MSEPRPLVWNYGGGTQSIAIAVLLAQGQLPRPDCIVMADTGREAQETWDYTAAHVAPLLASLGLTIAIAPHTLATVDLYAADERVLIPAYTATGQLRNFCSNEWKGRVVERYLRTLGYGPRRPIRQWLGISLDEIGRLKPSGIAWIERAWPLVFDHPLRRSECRARILAYGLPEPPRSSCWMCPYRGNAEWRRLRDAYPADWARAVAFDEQIRARDTEHALYVHRSAVPLAAADLGTPDAPPSPLFGNITECDSGQCWM